MKPKTQPCCPVCENAKPVPHCSNTACPWWRCPDKKCGTVYDMFSHYFRNEVPA